MQSWYQGPESLPIRVCNGITEHILRKDYLNPARLSNERDWASLLAKRSFFKQRT
jgi:hypothetical protein